VQLIIQMFILRKVFQEKYFEKAFRLSSKGFTSTSIVICSNNFVFIHVKFFVHIFNSLFLISLLFILSISKFCNAKNDILFSSKMNTLLKNAKKISSILIGIKKVRYKFQKLRLNAARGNLRHLHTFPSQRLADSSRVILSAQIFLALYLLIPRK